MVEINSWIIIFYQILNKDREKVFFYVYREPDGASVANIKFLIRRIFPSREKSNFARKINLALNLSWRQGQGRARRGL